MLKFQFITIVILNTLNIDFFDPKKIFFLYENQPKFRIYRNEYGYNHFECTIKLKNGPIRFLEKKYLK